MAKKKLIILIVILTLLGGLSMASALTDNEQELLNALKLASKYLSITTDSYTDDLVYRTPAQRLRESADNMERKDRDINLIREVIIKYRETKK